MAPTAIKAPARPLPARDKMPRVSGDPPKPPTMPAPRAMDAPTGFYRSQVGGAAVISYAYTDMPWRLLASDIYYFFAYSWALPSLVLPVRPYGSAELDELFPSLPNLFCLLVHLVLALLQLSFLLLLPLALLCPLWAVAAAVAAFAVLNGALCRLLNGPDDTYTSDDAYARHRPEHAHEQWVFINGVAVGRHWMKSNLNRLALTFGRPVLGIHNRTSGILLDVVECLVQRNLTYATADVRRAYKTLRDLLHDPAKSRVMLVLHSQGGIVGGLVLDWLLQEAPQDLLAKLEVYTFGNAANHFNNPHRHALSQRLARADPRAAMATMLRESSFASPSRGPGVVPAEGGKGGGQHGEKPSSRTLCAAKDRAIGHVEHYAHSTDFVALWGVVHFATNRAGSPQLPRFLGRLFSRAAGRGGHQLNQHYLDGMFPLWRDPATQRFVGADEHNDFMEERVRIGGEPPAMAAAREALDVCYAGTRGFSRPGALALADDGTAGPRREIKVKELSRLWAYRNGQSPPALVADHGLV